MNKIKTIKKVKNLPIIIVIALFISLMLILYYNLIDFESSSVYFGGILGVCSFLFSFGIFTDSFGNYNTFIFKDKYNVMYKTQNYQIIEGKYYIEGYIKEINALTGNEEIKLGWIEVDLICIEKNVDTTLIIISWIIYILVIILTSL